MRRVACQCVRWLLVEQEWSEARDRRLCHSCRVVRPLRSKHSPSLNVDKCVPRFDHHCPWVGNTVGYNNHPWFLAYVACAMGCLWTCCVICASFLMDNTSVGRGGILILSAFKYTSVRDVIIAILCAAACCVTAACAGSCVATMAVAISAAFSPL